ncbi:MAG: hypothetical protein AAFQ59_14655 [Pseudomonadota bacterium]
MRVRIWKEKKTWAAVLLCVAGPAVALTETELASRGYVAMDCLFDQRCVIGQPCMTAWRDVRWMMSDDEGTAYEVRRNGEVSRRAMMMKDARWKDTSEARAIVMQMREAVASHLTVFDGGGAIQSFQYAANPGAGQFYLGKCEVSQP